jgi:hypothetical protein
LTETHEYDLELRARILRIANHYAPRKNLQATVVMVAAFFSGPDERKIAHITGYSRGYVEEVGERLRVSRLWTEKGIDYGPWTDDEKGWIGFLMDLAVAEGIVIRTDQKRNGEYLYQSLIQRRRCKD